MRGHTAARCVSNFVRNCPPVFQSTCPVLHPPVTSEGSTDLRPRGHLVLSACRSRPVGVWCWRVVLTCTLLVTEIDLGMLGGGEGCAGAGRAERRVREGGGLDGACLGPGEGLVPGAGGSQPGALGATGVLEPGCGGLGLGAGPRSCLCFAGKQSAQPGERRMGLEFSRCARTGQAHGCPLGRWRRGTGFPASLSGLSE